MHGGFGAFMRKFAGVASSAMPSSSGAGTGIVGNGSAPKAAAAKRSAVAKPKASAKVSSSTKRATPSSAVTPIGQTEKRHASDGNVDTRQRQRKRSADNAGLEAEDEISGGGDITGADKLVLDAFFDKLKPLCVVNPPLADAAMRSWCTDYGQKLTTLCNELKAKKKSANRRRNEKAEDAAFMNELSKYETTLKDMIKLNK